MQKIVQAVLILALLAPAAAWTQQKGALVLKSSAEVEVAATNDKGEKTIKRVDIEKAVKGPGDTVVFTTTYINTGKQPASGVVITNPIDEHMIYVDRSAAGNNTLIEFSIDGGKTYQEPGKLMVSSQGLSRPVRGEDYTNIRWTIIKPVPAGEKGSVSFKAKIK
jgi:uncharacterized repeat protein (TIGR01451 family)